MTQTLLSRDSGLVWSVLASAPLCPALLSSLGLMTKHHLAETYILQTSTVQKTLTRWDFTGLARTGDNN